MNGRSDGKFSNSLWKVRSRAKKCTSCIAEVRLNHSQVDCQQQVARYAHTFVQFAWRRAFFTAGRVFHSFFISVFRSICVKRGSPSRMNRGSVSVKSTIADGFPSRRPPSTMPSIRSTKVDGSSDGSKIGGSPLFLALVEISGPVL